ncbi:nose resistant to fluoxetine protein 6-like [Centruroides vittatus]|uniref:nose resistant to fluoxetine protein 6-like n=1 Tax=Centruroides vittatus TaxID=120091 RepID=UPI003510975D
MSSTKKKFKSVSLSRNTVASRVDEIADNLRNRHNSAISTFQAYSIAIDESTDIRNIAQLAVFIRGCNVNLKISEELLEIIPMHNTTTGADIFDALMEVLKYKLPLEKLVCFATDGAPTMTGITKGVVARLKETCIQHGNSNFEHFDCIVHQQVLRSKVLNSGHVLKIVIKIVNYIRARGLNDRQFASFPEDIECEYTDLPYYTDVRWLSSHKVLKRFFTSLDEIITFLETKNFECAELKGGQWINDLAFSVDITSHLNQLNLKLRGKNHVVTTLFDNINAFKQKLSLWRKQIEKGSLSHYKSCQYLLLKSPKLKFTEYAHQIKFLELEFNRRFSDFKSCELQFRLFTSPLSIDIETVDENLQMELIEIQYSIVIQVNVRFDICIPSDCHEDDLRNILNWLVGSEFSARVDYCKAKNQKVVYSTAQIICLSFFAFFSSWVVLATFVETLMELGIISSSAERDTATRNLIFVSLYRSISKLRSHCIRDRTAVFCGIKFFIICIVVYGHIFIALATETVENLKNFPELFNYIPVEVACAGFSMIEIFFFISAFLLSYYNQNSVKSATDIFVLLTKKINRLSVPVFCLVAATIILPLLSDGPHWNDVLNGVHEIAENWSKYVFHYNNFIEYKLEKIITLQHLWFISALFQQILVAIPLLYINNRWPNYGKIITVMLIVAGVVSHVVNTIVYKDHTMFGYSVLYTKYENYLNHNYFKPYYTHLNSFFTGFLFGCFLLKKKEMKFGHKTLLVFWVGSIILLMLAIFGLHGYKREMSPNDTIVYLHHTLSPFAFTVATAWISVACITGYGGICNRIFSLRIFCMLDKLTIWIYMLHVLVMIYIYGQLRSRLYASEITTWMLFLMVMCLTLIASLFMHLFVETPLNYLIDKIINIFCKKERVDKKEECRIDNLRENQNNDNNEV